MVDASVWVSRFREQDVNHAASRVWMEGFTTAGGLLVSPIFLQIEVASAVSRLTRNPVLARQAVGDLTHIHSINFVPMDDALVQTAINMSIELQLRAGDTIYVAAAYRLGIPLVSWDREQLERGSRIVTTFSPDTYPF